MKKIFATLLAAALMLTGTQAFAQIAVGAGYMNATEKLSAGSYTDKLDLNGVYAGAAFRFCLDDYVDGLSLAPGAYLDLLFGKHDGSNHRDIALQVPVHVNYAYELTDDFKIFGFAGPAFHLGLVKKESYKSNGQTLTSNLYDKSYVDALNRFNLLLGVGAGFEVAEMIQIVVGADFGLLNLSGESGVSYKRPSQIKIGINYIL